MLEKQKKKPQNYRYFLTVRRYLLIAIGMCLGSVTLFFSIIFPKIQDIQVHRSDLERQQKKLDQLNQKADLLANATRLEAFREKERINTVLPNTKPLLPVIHQLESISGQSGVIVSGISLSPGEISTESAELKKKSSKASSASEIEMMEIEMTISGSVEEINSFLSLVNTMSPITDLSSLSLTRVKANTIADQPVVEQGSRFEAKIILASYYLQSQFSLQLGQALPDLSRFNNTVLKKIQEFPMVEIPTTPPSLLPETIGKENLFE